MTYHIITTLLWPVFFIYTLKISLRYKSLIYFKQRLGFACPRFEKKPLWIHCASVGEVNTFLPLLKLFQQHYPEQQFLITTNTPTGAYIVAKNKLVNTTHCYLPIDTTGSVKRFLKATHPSIAVIMETELWPLLYRQCHNRDIPITIINGRLSHRTLNAHHWIKKQYITTLGLVDKIFTRSEDDKNHFQQLGASAEQLEVVGNLKFSLTLSTTQKPVDNFTSRNYILAASTHDDEEQQLARLWKKLRLKNYLLVIAPRHPKRSEAILQQLKPLGLKIAVRSHKDKITETTDIYIADTLGELTDFMRYADIVFMGGSLIPHGGQNLLEPAYLGKAIITGTHCFNFQPEVELLVKNNACIQVNNITELGEKIQQLIENRELRHQLENNAQNIMTDTANVAEDYFARLDKRYARYFSNQ